MSKSMITAEEELSFEALAHQVDQAIDAVGKLKPEDREVAHALRKALEALHRHVLMQIVRRLKASPEGKNLLFELLNDPGIYASFLMHRIVKPDIHVRVAQVLELVRPYIKSHGGDVELVRIEGNVVYVRLLGACTGCSMSAVTLRDGVEEAIKQHIPEIQRVEVVPDEVTPGFIAIDDVGIMDDTGWVQGPSAEAVLEGKPYRMKGEGYDILLVRKANTLFAYKNACAHMGLPLDGGILQEETLICPWHGFRFDITTGECLTTPHAQLEPYPLRIQDGIIWVRPQ